MLPSLELSLKPVEVIGEENMKITLQQYVGPHSGCEEGLATHPIQNDDNANSPPPQMCFDDGDRSSIDCSMPHTQACHDLDPLLIYPVGPSTSYVESATDINGSVTSFKDSTTLTNTSYIQDIVRDLVQSNGMTIVHPDPSAFLDETLFRSVRPHAAVPSSRTNHTPIFPWKYGFVWAHETGRLSLAGEWIRINASALPSSVNIELCSSHSIQALTSISTISTTGPSRSMLTLASEDVTKQLVDILHDHHSRTCQSKTCLAIHDLVKQSSRTREYSKGGFLSRGMKSGSATFSGSPGGHMRAGVSGLDDNSSGRATNHQHGPATVNPEKRWLVCPFAVWRPGYFDKCAILKLEDIPGVRKHLREAHCPEIYCEYCQVEGQRHERHESSFLKKKTQLFFVTREKYALIDQYRDSTKPAPEQWKHLWGVLFPDQPVPSCFMDEFSVELLQHLEDYCTGRGYKQLNGKWLNIFSDHLHCRLDQMKHFRMAYDKWIVEVFGQLRQAHGLQNREQKRESGPGAYMAPQHLDVNAGKDSKADVSAFHSVQIGPTTPAIEKGPAECPRSHPESQRPPDNDNSSSSCHPHIYSTGVLSPPTLGSCVSAKEFGNGIDSGGNISGPDVSSHDAHKGAARLTWFNLESLSHVDEGMRINDCHTFDTTWYLPADLYIAGIS